MLEVSREEYKNSILVLYSCIVTYALPCTAAVLNKKKKCSGWVRVSNIPKGHKHFGSLVK